MQQPIKNKINWDSPKGPCGELFKDAFRCFAKNLKDNDNVIELKCMKSFEKLSKCRNSNNQENM